MALWWQAHHPRMVARRMRKARRAFHRDLHKRAWYSIRRTQRFGFVTALIKQSSLGAALWFGTENSVIATYILWSSCIGGIGLCISAIAHKQWPHILTNSTTATIATLGLLGFGIGGH